MRVLVVEDHPCLLHHLKTRIGEKCHLVDPAENSQEADKYRKEHNPDVAIIDLGLPGEDGLRLIRRWRREQVTLPILVLTARESWQDKVTALEAGADDYVTKPFHLEEVIARMQALVRRNSGLASQVIDFSPFQLDLSQRELRINHQPVALTAFEYIITETLIRKAGQIISKNSLMLQLHSNIGCRENHTLDVLIGRIRKKIHAQYKQKVITTVRGRGYRFDMS